MRFTQEGNKMIRKDYAPFQEVKKDRSNKVLGSNQFKMRNKTDIQNAKLLVGYLMIFTAMLVGAHTYKSSNPEFISPVAVQKAEAVSIVSPTPANAPSELVEIVAYITEVFEPEGKQVVVRAINCFYSESGLRKDAVGQNTDGPKSKDHGVAQLNDYWHNLTSDQKTEVKANIDKAYQIYKGRGGNFSAWYGKLCN